jgi:hypothetical protein
MFRRSFVAVLMVGCVAQLGCGKQEPAPAPTGPSGGTPPSVGTPPTPSTPPADHAAFEALKKMKVNIRAEKSKYDVQISKTDLKEDGTIKPEVFEQLKKLEQPTSLTLMQIPIADAGLGQVAQIPAVREVFLNSTPLITDQGLQKLSGMDRLTRLQLSELKLTDASFAFLKGMKRLERLDIEQLPIGDEALAHLEGLSELQSFGLENIRTVSTAGLTHLKRLPKLKRVHVVVLAFDTKLDEDALKELADIPSLEELKLGPWIPANAYSIRYVTDTALAHLARLKNLKKLDLGCCPSITDKGIAELKGLTNLEELGLCYCVRVTAASLANFKNMTKLQSLDIRGTAITKAGLADLQKALPNLKEKTE